MKVNLEILSLCDKFLELFDFYGLPNLLKNKAKLDFGHSDPQTISIMNDSSTLASIVDDIGINPGTLNLNNTTFSNAMSNLLDGIRVQQTAGNNLLAHYGSDIQNIEEFDYQVDIPFPLASPVFIKIGAGITYGRKEKAPLQEGYWVKGLPLLSFQGQNYDNIEVQFTDVMDYLWDNIRGDTNWGVLGGILIYAFIKNTLFPWLDMIEEDYIVDLNDEGSYLALKNTSLPDTLSEAYCEYWTWQDEPENPDLTQQARDELIRFNRELRRFREEIAGMRYGIGGFYGFVPKETVFTDSALISISYSDDEVADIDENSLAVYWEDDDGNWHHLPSVVYADSNRVEALIPDFRTYTLAPRLPQGMINLQLEPDSLAADGISTIMVSADNLYNNDGTPVSDGTQYTVVVDRGTIVTPDVNASLDGIQISAQSGVAAFEVQSDLISMPILAAINSVNGFADGQIEIPVYDIAPPQTPTLLAIESEHRSLKLDWQPVSDPDLAGYKIYFDNDESGEPYNGTANYQGENSPVIVGLISEYTLTGLSNDDTYYVAITAFDVSGSESGYSNELSASPELKAVSSLQIELLPEGAKLLWDQVEGANSYRIYRSTEPTDDTAQMQLVKETSATSWIDADALNADQYFYVVVTVGY